MAKEEFLRHLCCTKVVLLKHRDGTCGQEELPWGHEEGPSIDFQVGRGSGIVKVSKELWKQGFQDFKGASFVGRRPLITV